MKNTMKTVAVSVVASALWFSASLQAAPHTFQFDTQGMHAFVQFRIKHFSFSWLYGRFNKFDGSFTYDEKNPKKSFVEVDIDIASLDSNHGERDKFLLSEKFLNVQKYPTARFVSTKVQDLGNNKGTITGDLTLAGVTRSVTLDVEHIGAGVDDWVGVHRSGFQGSTVLTLKDFGINSDTLGPAAAQVELILSIEGTRPK